MRQFILLAALIAQMLTLTATAQKSGQKGHDLRLTVLDKDSREAIIMATVQLQPTGIVAVTDADGHATLHNIADGTYTLQVSYVGYESQNIRVKLNKPLTMQCLMVPTTLALQEVSVVARQKAGGASTTSVI